MPETTNKMIVITIDNLAEYHGLLIPHIEGLISESEAKSIKSVGIEGNVLKFYKVESPSEDTEAAYTIELPETDISNLLEKFEAATAGHVVTVAENGKDIVDSGVALEDLAKKEDDIFVTDILTVNALGGISANADLNGMTTHEILETLLYPYVAQVVGTPSRTPNATVLEKGDDQTITAVSVQVTKKSKDITSVALYNGDTLIEEKTGDTVAKGGTINFTGLSIAVPSSSVVLTVKVTDASGNVVSKNTAGWNFVYPYYTGVCGENDEITEDLVEGLTKKVEVKGNKSWAFTTDNQRCVIAYPKSYGVLKNAIDPNGFENISAFTQYEVSVTGLDGTPQAYYVYANGASTVTNFTFTFKY